RGAGQPAPRGAAARGADRSQDAGRRRPRASARAPPEGEAAGGSRQGEGGEARRHDRRLLIRSARSPLERGDQPSARASWPGSGGTPSKGSKVSPRRSTANVQGQLRRASGGMAR